MPEFTEYNGAIVVSPVGKPSLCYVIRTDQNQIAVLNMRAASPDWSIYRCHPFTGQDPHRNQIKRIAQVQVFGVGSIPTTPGSAYMVVVADQSRTNVYPYSALSPNAPQRMMWDQRTHGLTGYVFDVCLLLMGEVDVREIKFSYTPITGL